MAKGRKGRPGTTPSTEHQEGREKQRGSDSCSSWPSTAFSAEPRVPPLATSRPAASEMISAGICDTRPSPTENLVKMSAALASAETVPRHADDDAAENIDGENDDAGDRVAAHEFRRAVHRAEEGAFLLKLAPARLRDLVVDEAGR